MNSENYLIFNKTCTTQYYGKLKKHIFYFKEACIMFVHQECV